jgi:hypothetical protein
MGDAEIDAFCEARVEPVQGEYVPPRNFFEAWRDHCSERGIEPGTQKAFSLKVQKRVAYERNSGRPRYCHIRLKPKRLPKLKVVA